MSEQRKPCPFCGAAPQERFVAAGDGSYFEISCRSCAVAMTERLWQRRMPGPATRAMLERFQRAEPANSCPFFSGREMRAFIAEWKGESS